MDSLADSLSNIAFYFLGFICWPAIFFEAFDWSFDVIFADSCRFLFGRRWLPIFVRLKLKELMHCIWSSTSWLIILTDIADPLEGFLFEDA